MGEDGLSHWCKSSFSGNGDCVEWLMLPDSVRVRDSKDHGGPILRFTHSEWRAFLRGVVAGEADLSVEPLP
jgi:hypothetical protein